LNPDVKLPRLAIAPIYRADGSGTNFLFTSYLAGANARFRSEVGASTAVEWPVGIGAKGNEGVANMTRLTTGAIGYVEYAFVKQIRMTYLRLRNREGRIVAPGPAAFQAAAAHADWKNSPGYQVSLLDQSGAGSWPLTGASFILMRREPKDARVAAETLKFFAWALGSGAAIAEDLGYVSLPQSLVRLVERTWAESIRSGGVPIWPVEPR
jgi:phosphate transport system substrate-binding protein